MSLELKQGDEIIVPAFTYVATAEVIALLGLTPVMVDVDPDTFNLTGEIFEKAITEKPKLLYLYICSDKVLIWKQSLKLLLSMVYMLLKTMPRL